MSKGLRDFSIWYCRHRGQWRWREKRPEEKAKELGHVTEGGGGSKGFAIAAVRLELQERAAPKVASATEPEALPEPPSAEA